MQHDGEKTFEEIGQAMGITKTGAHKLYQSALRKLRRNGQAARLCELAREIERQRGQRLFFGKPDG